MTLRELLEKHNGFTLRISPQYVRGGEKKVRVEKDINEKEGAEPGSYRWQLEFEENVDPVFIASILEMETILLCWCEGEPIAYQCEFEKLED